MGKRGVLGISFDHMHMGDLLRQVAEHPDAEIAGIFDPDRARMAARDRDLRHPGGAGLHRPRRLPGADQRRPRHRLLGDRRARATRSSAIAPARAQRHGREAVRGERRRRAPDDRGDGAGRADGSRSTGRSPGIRSHNTAKRLIDEGAIGELVEVHFYDGNRGPLYPSRRQGRGLAARRSSAQKPTSWWYKRASGGGSLLDYLGYGTTLGTWFMDGEAPVEVTCVVDETPGIEVDQHSITVCRYARGLSKFETRWGTLTDPWTQQPQPKCGFVLVGTRRHASRATTTTTSSRCRPGRAPRAGRRCRPTRCRPGGAGRSSTCWRASPTARRSTGPLDPALCADRPADDRQRRALGAREADGAAGAMTEPDLDAYALKAAAAAEVAAPELPYRPPMPRSWRPRIALVGAGGISAAHLAAYRDGGLRRRGRSAAARSPRAEARRDEFFPGAEATDDVARTLGRDDIEVVDLTPHPAERLAADRGGARRRQARAVAEAVRARPRRGRAALPTSPTRRGVVLAVNQNGRWAPHLAFMREAVRAGLIGERPVLRRLASTGTTAGSPARRSRRSTTSSSTTSPCTGSTSWRAWRLRATSVFATRARAAGQAVRPPLLAAGAGRLRRRPGDASPSTAATRFGAEDRTFVGGSAGSLASRGPDLGSQQVRARDRRGRRAAAARGHLVQARASPARWARS